MKKTSPNEIANAGFKQTSEIIQQRTLVLAIQDTTDLTFKHNVTKELDDVSSSKSHNSKTRTLYLHSTLAIDANSEKTIGLVNQFYYY